MRMIIGLFGALAFAIGLAGATAPARAAISCSASGTLAFGTIDVLAGTATPAQPATISFSCSGAAGNTTSVTLCFSLGAGQSSTWPPRQLANGTNRLNVELYKDTGLTNVLGTWSAYTTAYAAGTTGIGIVMPITSGAGSATANVYGTVLGSQQRIPSGAHSNNFVGSARLHIIQNRNTNTAACGDAGPTLATASFSASANIQPNCRIAATNLAFGAISSTTQPTDATSQINLQCSNALPYIVSLSGGLSGASDPTRRKMTSGNNTLVYGLYRDAARSLPWGDTSGVNTAAGTGTALHQTLTVYGRVPGQSLVVGSYSDTISVTVSY